MKIYSTNFSCCKRENTKFCHSIVYHPKLKYMLVPCVFFFFINNILGFFILLLTILWIGVLRASENKQVCIFTSKHWFLNPSKLVSIIINIKSNIGYLCYKKKTHKHILKKCTTTTSDFENTLFFFF